MIKEAKEGLYNDLKYTFILRQASKNEQAKKKKKTVGEGDPRHYIAYKLFSW